MRGSYKSFKEIHLTVLERIHQVAENGSTPHTATTGCSHLCQANSLTLRIAGNRHHSTGAIKGPPRFMTIFLSLLMQYS